MHEFQCYLGKYVCSTLTDCKRGIAISISHSHPNPNPNLNSLNAKLNPIPNFEDESSESELTLLKDINMKMKGVAPDPCLIFRKLRHKLLLQMYRKVYQICDMVLTAPRYVNLMSFCMPVLSVAYLHTS